MVIFLAVTAGVFLIVSCLFFITLICVDRWVRRHFVASTYGLPPREVLDGRRPGPPPPAHRTQERQAVADAAWQGDWNAAERYVRAAGEDWDERWGRLEFLHEVAQRDDAWLHAWRAAQPGNCDAATLHAYIVVRRAWEIRGSAYARAVPTPNMNHFRAMLWAAIEDARRAALLDPANPGPWVVMVMAARGARYGHSHFEPLWRGLVARAPFHYMGHSQALQYWCAKWYGSNADMMWFAFKAVRKAPAGSPLAGIYLHALSELADGSAAVAMAVRPLTRRVLRRIAASFDRVVPDDERLPGLRHLLAHHMLRSMMYAPALEQFRQIGPWCGAEPWRKKGNSVMAFEAARGRAVKLSRARPAPTSEAYGMAR
ncbi:hypothetical protein [Streptomyces sp. NPDC017435]|uniref:hypothetical protein n=1 Tax=Streptomyces sp. NPDC017435 TaxID=3364995 RepID=UPI003794F99E